MYFNTTSQSGSKLIEYLSQAHKQNDIIKKILMILAKPMSPFDIKEVCNELGHHWPITSIRRALTTLSDDTKSTGIYKTDDTKMSPYKRPEHLWCWSPVDMVIDDIDNWKTLVNDVSKCRMLLEKSKQEDYLDG